MSSLSSEVNVGVIGLSDDEDPPPTRSRLQQGLRSGLAQHSTDPAVRLRQVFEQARVRASQEIADVGVVGDEGVSMLVERLRGYVGLGPNAHAATACLTSLDLDSAGLGPKGAHLLLPAVRPLSSLKWLVLDANRIEDEGAIPFVKGLSLMHESKLMGLGLSSVGLTAHGTLKCSSSALMSPCLIHVCGAAFRRSLARCLPTYLLTYLPTTHETE